MAAIATIRFPDPGEGSMNATRIPLLAAALVTPAFLAAPADAVPCVHAYGVPPENAYVLACVDEAGCPIYLEAGNDRFVLVPICLP